MTEKNEWNIEKILTTTSSYWQACTLHSAVLLDVFTIIGDGRISAEELALSTDSNLRGVETLLNALVAMGLLIKESNRYANIAQGNAYLNKNSPHYLGYIIMHHANIVPSWALLHKAVKTGTGVRERSREPRDLENFLMGMYNLAMAIAPNLAKEIDFKGKRHLLDLGGGPGTYAIQFCLNNSEMDASVFDLPETRVFAVRTIEKFGLSDRIKFIDGNYLQDTIPGNYDVVWLSHILHAESPRECENILAKTVASMAMDGLIFIHEFILDDNGTAPLFPALFSLNMLVGTKEGRSYRETELRQMLANAGVRDIRRMPFTGPNSSGILCGTKS